MAGFAASSQIFEASNHRRWVTGGSRPDQRICRVLIGFGFAGKIGKIKPDLCACFRIAVFASLGEIGRDLRRTAIFLASALMAHGCLTDCRRWFSSPPIQP